MQVAGASGTPDWAWVVFGIAVLGMLALDLWVLRGGPAESHRAALIWTIVWIGLGLAFGGFVWALLDATAAQEYYAAYAIEKALSLDNLLLFYVVFQTVGIAQAEQHKVLFWGILGAVTFRAIFIFVGVAALQRWEWVSWVFGGILLLAAVQAFRKDPASREESRTVEWLSERLPVATRAEHGEFLARHDGKRLATPLLVALIAIEVSDVVLAIDSVPAALAITRNEFVVYSSNVFAIMGLRALYLYLASVLTELRYLHYGLAIVLAFAAFKIVGDEWLHVPPLFSVLVIVGVIGGSVWASLRARRDTAAQSSSASAPSASSPRSSR